MSKVCSKAVDVEVTECGEFALAISRKLIDVKPFLSFYRFKIGGGNFHRCCQGGKLIRQEVALNGEGVCLKGHFIKVKLGNFPNKVRSPCDKQGNVGGICSLNQNVLAGVKGISKVSIRCFFRPIAFSVCSRVKIDDLFRIAAVHNLLQIAFISFFKDALLLCHISVYGKE